MWKIFLDRYQTYEQIFNKLTDDYKIANDLNETEKRLVN